MAGRLLRELTIRQLRALAAVQKNRSVTSAAKQLHLTQPAVTQQLRKRGVDVFGNGDEGDFGTCAAGAIACGGDALFDLIKIAL